MLAPQFSLRRLLLVMALFGVFFLFVGFAVGGARWAVATSVAVGWLMMMLGAYMGAFFAVWLVSLLPLSRRQRSTAAVAAKGGSPFAAPIPAGPGSPFAATAVPAPVAAAPAAAMNGAAATAAESLPQGPLGKSGSA
jgi:hypothetical protein